jgi:hypothetical protein
VTKRPESESRESKGPKYTVFTKPSKPQATKTKVPQRTGVTKRLESESRESKGPKHTGATKASKGTVRAKPGKI